MPYCTQQDLVDRFSEPELVQLTDRGNTGNIDAIVLGQAIDDASAEIDTYLVGQYLLPLSSVPDVLVRVSCDITRYYLYDDQATEQVSKRYEMALKWLALLASGKVSLGLNSAGAEVTESSPISISSNDAIFTSTELASF